MFSNLLFLALAILLTSLVAEAPPIYFTQDPAEGFVVGICAYLLTLILISWQTRTILRKRPYLVSRMLFITNGELLLGLSIFGFVFGGHQILQLLPLSELAQTMHVILNLSLYFTGLAVFHWSSYQPSLAPDGDGNTLSQAKYVEQQFRFLAPFTLPFLFFTLLTDLLIALPETPLTRTLTDSPEGMLSWISTFGGSLFFLALVMIFLPYWITTIWRCRPIPEGPLKERLEGLCQRADFRHAGVLTWPVMTQAATAAIIGVVPRYRYVMFSQRLLRRLSPESIEAVLAHEMGHSKHKHLVLYPFIIFGSMVLIGYYSFLLGPSISHYLSLQRLLNDHLAWRLLEPLALFLPYVVILSVYFRLVFGYFSRMFERQADLHVFRVGMRPESMRQALNEVAILSGNIHDHPSWHHYSIRQRMRFLEQAAQQSTRIAQHDARVRRSLFAYFLLVIPSLVLLLSASTGAWGPLKKPAQWLQSAQQQVDYDLNTKLRRQVIDQRLQEASLHGQSRIVRRAFENSLRNASSMAIPGVAEFFAAEQLVDGGHYTSSAEVMELAWQRFDFSAAAPKAREEFIRLTQRILWGLEVARAPALEGERLRATLEEKTQDLRGQK